MTLHSFEASEGSFRDEAIKVLLRFVSSVSLSACSLSLL